MKTIRNYNLYIFISTITRNIIDIYSVIYFYKQGITIKEIIAIYTLTYFLGFFISPISIKVGAKVGYKYILLTSSIITSIAFYIANKTTNIYLLSLFLSLSIFTYHPIRHLYGIKLLKYKKEIGNTLIFIYLANFFSSYIVLKNIEVTYLLITAIIGIIPALFIKKEKAKKISYPKNIPKQKFTFFVLDQFKIIFLLFEPLYLYLISSSISYVGIFMIVLTISSVVYMYLLIAKVDIEKYYKYLNIIFTIMLVLKINITNKHILLIIAFFEGMGIKTNELISTMNLYEYKSLTEGYIIISEKMFCIIRSLILSIIYFLPLNLKIVLYLLIIGVFLLGFAYKKNPN